MATATTIAKGDSSKSSASKLNTVDTFVWSGTDKRGVKLKSEQVGKNAGLIKAELRRQGITVTSIKKKSKPLFGAAGKPASTRDIAIFSRQISTMMAAGVPMIQAFEIIAGGQANPRVKTMLTEIKTEIEGGSSLAEALGKYPVEFDELFRNLVRAGEVAGVLDTILDTVATYKENIEAIKGKIKKAMFYPAMVMVVAVVVSAVLLIFVVPQFENVFKNFGAELPAFTQMIVGASRLLTNYWWIVVLAVGGVVTALVMFYKRSERFAHLVARIMLRLPVIGQLLHQSAIARFSRTLGVTFKAGVPLVEALDSVAGATGSIVYGEAVKRIREDVSVGHQLQLAMRQAQLFPNMVVQMVAIGEESGALDKMLFKVAEFYEAEVNNAVDSLSSLLEPLIMVVIGVLVGGLVIGMYLPIFKLGSVV